MLRTGMLSASMFGTLLDAEPLRFLMRCRSDSAERIRRDLPFLLTNRPCDRWGHLRRHVDYVTHEIYEPREILRRLACPFNLGVACGPLGRPFGLVKVSRPPLNRGMRIPRDGDQRSEVIAITIPK